MGEGKPSNEIPSLNPPNFMIAFIRQIIGACSACRPREILGAW